MEWQMQAFQVWTLDSNPKMGTKGVTQLLFIYVKEPRLNSLT